MVITIVLAVVLGTAFGAACALTTRSVRTRVHQQLIEDFVRASARRAPSVTNVVFLDSYRRTHVHLQPGRARPA